MSRQNGLLPMRALSSATCQALVAPAQAGDRQAREALVRGVYPFLMTVASPLCGHGVDFEDLVQVGALGVLEALPRYNASFGCHFLTYARWWIYQRMTKEIHASGRTVKIPSNVAKELADYRDAPEGAVEAFYGRRKDDGVDPEERHRHTQSRVGALVGRAVRLDVPWEHYSDNGRDRTWLDRLADERPLPDTALDGDDLLRQMENLVERLTDARLKRIVRLRFGLPEPDERRKERAPLKLGEIGAEMGLSKERVRQLLDRALGRLRRAAHAKEEWV